VLTLTGPDADANKMAVISIGDREQWRNFVLDIEFTIEKQGVDFHLHLGGSTGPNTQQFYLWGEGKDATLSLGQTYRARASMLGSKFRLVYVDDQNDVPPPVESSVSWTINRKGAIGLVVPPGARVKFSRFQVKELH
jgi:hypothetical protein